MGAQATAELLRFITLLIKMCSNALTSCELKNYIFMVTNLEVKGIFFFSKLRDKYYIYDYNHRY